MRNSITVARKYGNEKWEVIHGQEVPYVMQLTTYNAAKSKHLNGRLVNDNYAEMKICELVPLCNVLTFITTKEAKELSETESESPATSKSKK